MSTAPGTAVFHAGHGRPDPGFSCLAHSSQPRRASPSPAGVTLQGPDLPAPLSKGLPHKCRSNTSGVPGVLGQRPPRLASFVKSDESISLLLGVCRAKKLSTAPFSGRKDKRKSHYSARGVVMAVSFEPLGETLLALELYIILDPSRAIIYLTGYL